LPLAQPSHFWRSASTQTDTDQHRWRAHLSEAVAARCDGVKRALDQRDGAAMLAAAQALQDDAQEQQRVRHDQRARTPLAKSPTPRRRGAPDAAEATGDAAAALRAELAALGQQQQEAEVLRAKLASRVAALRERAAELGELHSEKKALEDKVRLWG
jgi:hypothetical protein